MNSKTRSSSSRGASATDDPWAAVFNELFGIVFSALKPYLAIAAGGLVTIGAVIGYLLA